MMTLTIWSDFACPYCYIGETRLQRAIDALGLKDAGGVEKLRWAESGGRPPEVAIFAAVDNFCRSSRDIEISEAKISFEVGIWTQIRTF